MTSGVTYFNMHYVQTVGLPLCIMFRLWAYPYALCSDCGLTLMHYVQIVGLPLCIMFRLWAYPYRIQNRLVKFCSDVVKLCLEFWEVSIWMDAVREIYICDYDLGVESNTTSGYIILQDGSNMTGTDLCVNKPHMSGHI